MRPMIIDGLAVLGILTACSGGSGAPSSETVPQLSDADYTSLCTYYNAKVNDLVGKQCDSTTVMQVKSIPCGTTNLLKGSSCAARVTDVESCVNGMNACVATGKDSPSGQCIIVNNCFPKR